MGFHVTFYCDGDLNLDPPVVLVKNVLYPIISSAFTIFFGGIGGSRYTLSNTPQKTWSSKG